VKLPADVAIIAPQKLRDYILSPTHPDGRGKAAYPSRFGYSQTDWLRLEHDLRVQHLILDAAPGRLSLYGMAVVSVPATFVRRATERDILTVREVAGR